MTAETHRQLASFIWGICNLLRGPYKRNEYRKVILPLTVLRRFDCILEPTKKQVLTEFEKIKAKHENVVRSVLERVSDRPFYNLSKLDFTRLLDDPNHLAPNLIAYINGFSPNVRTIMEKFKFEEQVRRMDEKNLLYEVVKAFSRIDLSPERVDNIQMGYVFEELIRIGAEQSNEEAGEHFTPREVITLMVNLLLSPERDLGKSHIVKTIYDPACGTGGMLSVADQFIREQNQDAQPRLYGQDLNDEAWAICRSDMLIKGEDAENIVSGDSFVQDGFNRKADGTRWTFDYMLANPPFGVEWKQQQGFIENERDTLGYEGRFGAGTPRITDGSLLFLQHMLSKMRHPDDGGSRIAIVFNGSPLFTGDAGSGESSIRQWIIENDWLEAIVALPEQLFYNTGIATYVWILTNRKTKPRRGKVQLVDARNHWVQMEKSLGNKRRRIGFPSDDRPNDPDHVADITRVHGDLQDGEARWISFDADGKVVKVHFSPPHGPVPAGEKRRHHVVSKVFDNADFGFRKITIERPLRLNFRADAERIARIEEESGFKNLATSKKKNEKSQVAEIEQGRERQEQIRQALRLFGEVTQEQVIRDRTEFLEALHDFLRDEGMRLTPSEFKAVVAALSERDDEAEICRDKHGIPEPDTDLRDTENVPLKEDIHAYFEREVRPHVPDAWIDESKTRIGYEIPFNRHFYVYEPPRPLGEIEADIKSLEEEILRLLREVTA